MEQDIGFRYFFQGGAEGRHQHGRQFLNKTDRIGEQNVLPTRQLGAARRGIEGGEKLIGRKHIGAAQRIEQRAFAGIRVANQSDHGRPRLTTVTAVQTALLPKLFELLFEKGNPAADLAPVNFQLRFTRSTYTDTTARATRAPTTLAC